MNRRVPAAALFALVALAVTGCGPSPNDTAPEGTSPMVGNATGIGPGSSAVVGGNMASPVMTTPGQPTQISPGQPLVGY